MLAQATGFGVLAALSPTALLVIAVFLGSAEPRRTGGYYLAGAILMSTLMGVIVLLALHAGGLSRPSEREPRYGLRLGIGVLALAAGAFILAAERKPAGPGKRGKGILARLIDDPSPRAAFLVGLLVFTPTLTFIAAIQVIATSRASIELTVLAMAIVVALNVVLVWLPILAHLVVPGWTTRTLASFNGWLRANARTLAAVVLVAAGAVLTVNGLTALL